MVSVTNPLSNRFYYNAASMNTSKTEKNGSAKNSGIGTPSSNKYDTASQLYANDNIRTQASQFISAANMNADDKNIKIAESMIRSGIPLTKENFLKIFDMHNKVDMLVNDLTPDMVYRLLQDDSFTWDIAELCDKIAELKKTNEENEANEKNDLVEKVPVSDQQVDEELKNIYGNKPFGETEREVAKHLLSLGTPVTAKNIQVVIKYMDSIEKLKNIDAEAITLALSKKMDITIGSLMKADGYIKAGYYDKNKISPQDLSQLEDDIVRILKANGFETTPKMIDAAKALIRCDADINKENILNTVGTQNNIEMLINSNNEEIASFLVSRGIDIEYDQLDKVINIVKDYLLNYKNKTDIESESIDAGQTLKDSEAAANLNKVFLQAYEEKDANRQIKDISFSDLKLMDDEIKRYLESRGIEPTHENIQISRALIKNQLDVNEENIAAFRELLNKYYNSHEGTGIRDRIVFKGKSVDISSIDSVLKTLKNSEEAVTLVHGYGSKAHKELQQLIDKIERIQYKSLTSIGMLMKNNLPLNIKNLDIAHRVLSARNNAMVDVVLDDTFDIPVKDLILPKMLNASNMNALEEVIEKRLEALSIPATREMVETSKALLENTLPINKANVANTYEAYTLLSNMAAISRDRYFPVMYDRLVKQNIDIETTPLDMLEKAFVQQKEEVVVQDLKNNESPAMLEQAKRVLQAVLPLKGVNYNHLSIMLKNNIPADIQKTGALKWIMDNQFSIAKAIRELDKISQIPEVEKSDLGNTIKELLSFAKKGIPQTDFKMLKEGTDVAEIQNQLAKKILLLEQQVKDVGAEWANPIRQLASNIRENIEVQNYLNRNDVYFQIPVLLHDKIANLNIHVFNRNRQKKASMGDDSLDVALNLETQFLGTLDINLHIQGKSVGADIMMGLPKDSKYLKSFGDMLSRRITDAGFKVSHINCKTVPLPTDYSKDEKTEPEDININSTSYFEVTV